MSDDQPLENKILEELRKTGYPTEIVTASIMQNRGWGVLHNPSYLDDIELRSREFDVRAYRQWRVEALPEATNSLTIGVYLVCESKKSEKPWVFFTTPEEYSSIRNVRRIKQRSKIEHLFWSSLVGQEPSMTNYYL